MLILPMLFGLSDHRGQLNSNGQTKPLPKTTPALYQGAAISRAVRDAAMRALAPEPRYLRHSRLSRLSRPAVEPAVERTENHP